MGRNHQSVLLDSVVALYSLHRGTAFTCFIERFSMLPVLLLDHKKQLIKVINYENWRENWYIRSTYLENLTK